MTRGIKPTSAREVLLLAADAIDTSGHCKGQYVTYSSGDGRITGLCVHGAIRYVASGNPVIGVGVLVSAAVDLLWRQVDPPDDLVGLVGWNDAFGRTAAEVTAALREAAGAEVRA